MGDGEFVRAGVYHDQMHRAYKVTRARVARRMSVIHPLFAATVLEEFRGLVGFLRLEPPRLGGGSS